MKPPIKIQTPREDKTEFENFVEFTRNLLKVPKAEIDKRMNEHKKKTQHKKNLQSK